MDIQTKGKHGQVKSFSTRKSVLWGCADFVGAKTTFRQIDIA